MTETRIEPQVEAVTTETAPVVETTTPVVETPEVVVAPEPVIEQAVVEPVKPDTLIAEGLDKNPLPAEETKPKEQPIEKAASEETPEATQDTTKTEEGQSEEPAPPPVYEDFTVPENVKLDTEQVKEFTGLLSELELEGKVDHTLLQAFGQKAVDFYVAKQQKAAEDLAKFYQTTWEKQKTDWKDAFISDPEIGGNRQQTTIDSAISFIRTHGGNENQQAEVRKMLNDSGLGNHPAMIRLLANAGRAMSEGQPLAAQQPPPQTKSRVATMYGK